MPGNTPKILYFGSFDAPFDTEVYICNTLESLGCEVKRQPTTKTSKEELIEFVSQKWDAIIFSKGWFNFKPEEVDEILSRNTNKTIGWFWDLCWGTPRERIIHQHHLFRADLVLTSDGGDRPWEQYHINHKTLRQGIYEPEAVIGNKRREYDYDVIFVGTNVHKDNFGWHERDDLLKFLSENYSSFRHFGTKESVRNLELNDLYASAKIVVGDSVYSPNYWSNRLYETIGRGGFLIFPLIPGIEKEFTPGEHFIPYHIGNLPQLKTKIDYYLTHDKEREEIKMAGFEHCKKFHTYTIRCKKLLEYIHEY